MVHNHPPGDANSDVPGVNFGPSPSDISMMSSTNTGELRVTTKDSTYIVTRDKGFSSRDKAAIESPMMKMAFTQKFNDNFSNMEKVASNRSLGNKRFNEKVYDKTLKDVYGKFNMNIKKV